MKRYLYYPGCSLRGTGKAYEESLLAVFKALDVELESVTPGLTLTNPVNAALGAVIECFPELQAELRNGESPLWSGHHAYPLLSPGFTRVSMDQDDQTKTAKHKG